MTRRFHVPRLPLNYLPRPDQLRPLVELLVSDGPQAAVGVVGVQGMGGIGKSVLAATAAVERQVQERFPDGIYWLNIGQSPDMLAIQRRLARDLGVPRGEIQFLDALDRGELENLLTGKSALLVLDDVWSVGHAKQLDVVRPPGRLLITSRNERLLQGVDAVVHRVDLLSREESLDLLAEWSGQQRHSLPPEATEVARECGHLPLALAIVGAMIQRRPTAWADAVVRLQRHDLAKLETRFPSYPHPNLLRAIQTSVDGLDDETLQDRFGQDVRQRYLELAVFPEEEPIPEAALAVLWGAAGLDDVDVRDLMDELVARSLAQRFDAVASADGDGSRSRATRDHLENAHSGYESRPLGFALRLHDLLADYLIAATDDFSRLHGQFVEAYAARCPEGFAAGTDDGYYFDHLAYHLARSRRRLDLHRLLCNADWLHARLAATDPAALIGDFRWIDSPASSSPIAGAGEAGRNEVYRSRSGDRELHDLRTLRDAIRLSAHVLVDDPGQLASQLLGRLAGSQLPTLKPLLAQLRQPTGVPLLRPVTCSLHPPGTALIRTLRGHLDMVNGVVVTPDGRLAISASKDRTLRVWNLDTGRTAWTLEGHSGAVNAVAVTPDGRRAISASSDHTLRVWDLATGQTVRTLEGHYGSVCAVVVTRDGRCAISASEDRMLRVWDLESNDSVFTVWGGLARSHRGNCPPGRARRHLRGGRLETTGAGAG